MIDFKTLQPLPLRRQRDAQDRERLAAVKETRERAKHKGRNHWQNWKRRHMAKAKVDAGKALQSVQKSAFSTHLAEVRAYWAGDRPDYPEKP